MRVICGCPQQISFETVPQGLKASCVLCELRVVTSVPWPVLPLESRARGLSSLVSCRLSFFRS